MSDPEVFGGLLQLPYPSIEGWRTRLAEWEAPGRSDLMLVAEVRVAHYRQRGLAPCVALGAATACAWAWASRWPRIGSVGVSVPQLMAALLDVADRWLGCLRIELHVYTDNAAAIALYRKFGSNTKARIAPMRCATAAMSTRSPWLGCTPTRRASRLDAQARRIGISFASCPHARTSGLDPSSTRSMAMAYQCTPAGCACVAFNRSTAAR